MSEQEIHDICEELFIKEYTINTDGSIDVDGNVVISNISLSKIPIKFNKVTGYFNCSYNCLTTLENSPKKIGKNFSCYSNRLTSLEGFPQKVGEYTHCYLNFYLESINGYNGDYKKLLLSDNRKYLIRKHKLNLINNIIKQ